MPGPWRHAMHLAFSCYTVSISSEMPGPWRPRVDAMYRLLHVSISSEMPGPWRLNELVSNTLIGFQSQARCQAPGDATDIDVAF